MTYEPKIVALFAFALACFSLGFTVTAVAYAAHRGAPAGDERVATLEVAASRGADLRDARGCNLRPH